MREQTGTLKDSLDETRKAVKASQTQADASLLQAKTSQVSARAAQESAEIARQSFEVAERPFLGVVTVTPEGLATGERLAVAVKYQNSGRTPAIHASVQTSLGFGRGLPEETCPPVGSSVSRGLFSRVTVPVDGIKVAYGYGDSVLSATEVEAINSGDITLYVYSRADYRGVGRANLYFTEYYGRYNPGIKKFDGCNIGNDAK
jgi:hypothetical protein